MLQVIASTTQTIITGRDVNYSLLMGGICMLQFSLGIFYTPLLIVNIAVVVLFVLLYVTSKFRITLTASTIVIEKSIYGLTVSKFTFAFSEASIINGNIEFARDGTLLKFIFERETFDTVEFCINSKYRTIGNTKESVALISALKEAVTLLSIEDIHNGKKA